MLHDETNEMIRQDSGTRKIGTFIEMAEVLSSAVLCIAILFTFVLRFAGVIGSSMFPTLKNGEWLAVTYIFQKPEHGDIVIISSHNGYHKPLVKRVIAVAGDEIDIVDSKVVLNGKVLDEPYLEPDVETFPASEGQSSVTYPARVPAGTVFVMGDNRTGSADSRVKDVGFVREDDLLGKVSFRANPFFVTKPSFEFTYKVK